MYVFISHYLFPDERQAFAQLQMCGSSSWSWGLLWERLSAGGKWAAAL